MNILIDQCVNSVMRKLSVTGSGLSGHLGRKPRLGLSWLLGSGDGGGVGQKTKGGQRIFKTIDKPEKANN